MPKRKSAAPSGKGKATKGRKVKAKETTVETTISVSPPSLSKVWSTITAKSSKKDCEAFAVLLSEDYMFRSLMDAHIHDAMAKDLKVLSHWLQSITTTTAAAPLTSTAVHCFALCSSNLDAALINDNSTVLFPSLHPWMPERYREFYLRSIGAEVDDSKKTKKSSSKAPFIVRVLEQLFAYFDQKTTLEKENNPDTTMQDTSDDVVEAASEEEDGDNAAPIANENEMKVENEPDLEKEARILMHRSLELLCDFLSVPAFHRTELIAYLQACHWTVRSKRAYRHMDPISQRLLDRIRKWVHAFPVSSTAKTSTDQSPSKPLSASERRSLYHERAAIVQKLCRRHYDLPDLVYAGVGLLCKPNQLRGLFSADEDGKILKDLLYRMRLIEGTEEDHSREFLLDVLEHYLVIEPDPLEELQDIPLYPTEQVLWDAAVVPPDHTSLWSSPVLSLPKLNTEFISFADYLWRNWELLRSESSYEIRSDMVDALKRLQPTVRVQFDEIDGSKQVLSTDFAGWARMALPCGEPVKITQVQKPRLGQKYPSQVVAEVTIDLKPYAQSLRKEWDALREYDNLFLVAVDASKMRSKESNIDDANDPDFPQRYGVCFVRGCMIRTVKDESGIVISDPTNKEVNPSGTKRTFQVALDPTQYAKDQELGNVYDALSIVVRRHGKVNNFRSVLESVRSLMTGVGSIPRVIPEWMQSVLLGHTADQASFRSEAIRNFARATVGVPNPDSFFDFCDTFVDGQHILESLQSMAGKITIDGEEATGRELKVPPNRNFRVRVVEDTGSTAEAVSYPKPDGHVGNTMKFTPRQVEAIRAGLSPGLSLVVGPPGTGKTDVAVQIIACLYHSFPKQRTVIVTHSNAALNDIFQKVMARGDIQERYMIRLGSGERDLEIESTSDFTKQGRVEYSMNRRKELLEQVQKLSESLGISGRGERKPDGSPSYTCETAEYFNQHQVVKRSRNFIKSAKSAEDPSNVADIFPFKDYFGTQSVSLDEANALITKLTEVFEELAEYRPLEMLRLQRQRADYLIMKQAKVVAMTCTHAAIARSSLIELGFEYDNVIIEEAGQMLEIETFIPLLLQRGELGFDCRLKRVTMLGDHNQLPPVIQNIALARYTNLDQSMFARLIKHNVPCTRLDKQGRARREIADLYRWRYSELGDLDDALSDDQYQTANAGFHRTLQVVNVDDYDGKGETTPTPYFYQNVGEAEYCVAVFQYMVLIGYSPQKISILTTYNGQKELINDIVSQRCAHGTPLAGVRPGAVATVDQYQGQQNDYILLSLVRTGTAVGHLKDIRRLIVAVSRARLGLYMFCRFETFAHVDELRLVFEKAAAADDESNLLQLVVGENHPTERKVNESAEANRIFVVEDVEQMGSIVAQMQDELAVETSTAKHKV